MGISKELLERYHFDACTNEERKQVEDWLFSDGADELHLETNDKTKLKAEMWAEIEQVMPSASKPLPKRSATYFMWKGAIAASLFIVVLSTFFYVILKKDKVNEPVLMSFVNTSSHHVKHVDAQSYSVAVGPNTRAKINSEDGAIDLSGSILISPKKDIILAEGNLESTVLRKGQTYILLKNEGGKEGIIVISVKNLLDLPPVMQKQITTQFRI